MRRRTLLAAVGATAATATAGRFGSLRDRLDESALLGWLAASNSDSEPHRFDLRVERDGETVHRSTHEVRGREGNVVYGGVADCTWGATPGDYRVSARVDGGAWTERAVSEFEGYRREDVACVTAQVRYRHDRCKIRFRDDCAQVESYDGGCAFANQWETARDDSR